MTGRAADRLDVAYSTASAQAVAAFVAARYDVPGPLECSLLQRGFDDSFKGYHSVRRIAPADLGAVHVFVPIRHIWLVGEMAGRLTMGK